MIHPQAAFLRDTSIAASADPTEVVPTAGRRLLLRGHRDGPRYGGGYGDAGIELGIAGLVIGGIKANAAETDDDIHSGLGPPPPPI